MTRAIGIDLGGNNIKGVLLDASGDILYQDIQPTETNDSQNSPTGQQWKKTVARMVLELKKNSLYPINAIGLAAPGLSNSDNSAIRLMPGRLNGLENFIWSDYLGENEVWTMNDAHAALIAESKFGVGKGLPNLVMLTLGTGVGGGILINGELYQGNYQMAGHLGHICLDSNDDWPGITGMPGTLENAMGDASILRRSFGMFQTTHELVEAYGQGNSFATYLWLDSVRKLALGICSLSNIFSPDLMILGGGITKAGDSLYQPLREFMEVFAWKNVGKKITVQQARYADMAGAVGAAGFALHKTQIKQ